MPQINFGGAKINTMQIMMPLAAACTPTQNLLLLLRRMIFSIFNSLPLFFFRFFFHLFLFKKTKSINIFFFQSFILFVVPSSPFSLLPLRKA
jgi:hypothetical protein